MKSLLPIEDGIEQIGTPLRFTVIPDPFAAQFIGQSTIIEQYHRFRDLRQETGSRKRLFVRSIFQ